jgi:hypothetical protein
MVLTSRQSDQEVWLINLATSFHMTHHREKVSINMRDMKGDMCSWGTT